MIIYRRLNGWTTEDSLMSRTTPWLAVMETDGTILFYGKDSKTLVDITYGDTTDLIEVRIYPVTSDKTDIGVLLDNREAELRNLLNAEFEKGKKKPMLTIDAVTLKVITSGDFTRFAPDLSTNMQVFIFEGEESDHPNIYMTTLDICTGSYENLFRVQTLASRWIYKPKKSTQFGKKLVFTLLNSVFSKSVEVPQIDFNGLRLPSNGKTDNPEWMVLDKWNELMELSGVDKVVITRNGIKYDNNTNPFDAPLDEPDLPEIIVNCFVERGYIIFSDMIKLGITRTIQLLPETRIVPVELDMPEIAKKMCIFEGMIHLIPIREDEALDEIFGNFELIWPETELTYPKFQLPSGKEGGS